MNLRSPNRNGGTLPTVLFLHSSFPRTRESRIVPHRISLVIRFRGYDITQMPLQIVAAFIFEEVHWSQTRRTQGRVMESAGS
jgi:hypothetical protein